MANILGIGNALVDIVVNLESDEVLKELNLPKGSMQLVENSKMSEVASRTQAFKQTIACGGSAANTINGLANLGEKTSFIGKVGKDDMGVFFRSDLQSNGITPLLLNGDSSTGRALALISPDSERTFAVNLGAAIELIASDLNANMFKGFQMFHVEGYLVQNHQLIEKALLLAKQSGLKTSLDLASYNVVEENRDFLESIVKNYVDILFANEEEAKSFTGMPPYEALNVISAMVNVAIVKFGAKGSIIQKGSEIHEIGITKSNCIDTTGAGDLYASGFLHGIINGVPLNICGELGAVLSGRVIEQIGPKMSENTWKELRQKVNIVLGGKKYTHS